VRRKRKGEKMSIGFCGGGGVVFFFLLRDSVYSCDRDYRKRLRIGINFLMLVA